MDLLLRINNYQKLITKVKPIHPELVWLSAADKFNVYCKHFFLPQTKWLNYTIRQRVSNRLYY